MHSTSVDGESGLICATLILTVPFLNPVPPQPFSLTPADSKLAISLRKFTAAWTRG